jgi:hypothetical protein
MGPSAIRPLARDRLAGVLLEHDEIIRNRIMLSSLCLSMISAQTPLAFVARENRFPLFRIML